MSASGLGHHVDRLAFGQANVCLAPVATTAGAIAEGLVLALHVHHVDRLDGDVEQRLDGGLDVGLGRGRSHLEHVLVQFLDARGLLGDQRRAQDGEDLLVVHASHSSTFLTASAVITTWSAPTRAAGSRPCTSRISTYGMLRAARYSASEPVSVTISGRSPLPSSASLATSALVLGWSTSNCSTTARRPWRLSSDRIAQRAARYILRLTFCSKLRGLAAKVTPPPTKIGAR